MLCNKNLSLLALLAWSGLTHAESMNPWMTQTSVHFAVHYQQQNQLEAQNMLQEAEGIYASMQPYFAQQPEQTHIVLRSQHDKAHAVTKVGKFPKIEIYLTPPDNSDTLERYGVKNWRHDILLHEYAHVLQTTTAKNIFHRHLKEGFAVYVESQATPNNGRLNSPYYQMVMRQEVASGALLSWRDMAIENMQWPSNKAAVYGAFFTAYLIDTYGLEAYLRMLKKYPDHYDETPELKEVYHQSYWQLWQGFQQAMQARFQPEIQAHQTRQQSRQIQTLLRAQRLPRALTEAGVLYSTYTDRFARNRLAKYNSETQNWQALLDLPLEISDLTQHQDKYAVTVLRELGKTSTHRLEVFAKGSWKTIDRIDHVHHVRWHPDGQHLIGIKIEQTRSSIWQIDPSDQSEPLLLWQGSSEETLGAFAVDPTGTKLIIEHQVQGQAWNLKQFNLNNKRWKSITQTPYFEQGPVYKDANHIFFAADAGGRSNIYELDLTTGEKKQWTDVIGGAFSPLWDPKLGLVFQHYGTDSFETQTLTAPQVAEAVSVALSKPVASLPFVASEPSRIQLAQPKAYQPLNTLTPSFSPIPSFSTNEVSFGLMVYGQDALGTHRYQITPTFDTKHTYFNVGMDYFYDQKWGVRLDWQHFYLDRQDPELESSQGQSDQEVQVLAGALMNTAWVQLDNNHYTLGTKATFYDQKELNPVLGNDPEEKRHFELELSNVWDYFSTNPFHPGSRWGFKADLTTSYLYNPVEQLHAGVLNFVGQVSFNLTHSTNLLATTDLGYTTSDYDGFALGGHLENELLNAYTRFRGYSSNHAKGRMYGVQRLEIKQLLATIDKGFELGVVGSGHLYGSVFAEAGRVQTKGLEGLNLMSVGASASYELAIESYRLPLTFTIAKGLTEDAPDYKFFFEFSLGG
jgi:hypothetical protein